MQHIWPTALETKWNIRIYRKTKFHIPHACQNQLSAISTAKVTVWSTLSGRWSPYLYSLAQQTKITTGNIYSTEEDHWFLASYFTPQIVPVKGGNAKQWTGFLIFRDVVKSHSTGRCYSKVKTVMEIYNFLVASDAHTQCHIILFQENAQMDSKCCLLCWSFFSGA